MVRLISRPKSINPNIILLVTCFGIFLAALDQMVVVTALPDIMVDLKVPVTELDQAAWIVIGYLLGYTAAMPLMGRISDVYGHARIYIVSLIIFLAGSLLAATATNLPWLVAARMIQAVGGGALVPVTMAIAGETYLIHRRAIALGVVGAAAEAGGVLGPLYGGVITETFGWRWIFWINLPLGLIMIYLVYLMVNNNKPIQHTVDYKGGVILSVSLACLVLGLTQTLGTWSSFYTILLLMGCVFFFLMFMLRELNVKQPVIDLSMFKNGLFSAANLTHLLVGAALIMAIVNIPLITDTIMGKEPLEGGLRLMRLTVMIPLGAIVGGFLCQRLGYRLPTLLGLCLAALSFYLLSHWPIDIAEPRLTRDLLIGGFGFGLVIAPISTAVINSVKEGQKATAASLVTLMRMLGMMMGLAVLTSWGTGRYEVLLGRISELEQLPEATLGLFHDFFLAAAVICLIALLPAMLMRHNTGTHLDQ